MSLFDQIGGILPEFSVVISASAWVVAWLAQFLAVANRRPNVRLFQANLLFNLFLMQFSAEEYLSDKGRHWRDISWLSFLLFTMGLPLATLSLRETTASGPESRCVAYCGIPSRFCLIQCSEPSNVCFYGCAESVVQISPRSPITTHEQVDSPAYHENHHVKTRLKIPQLIAEVILSIATVSIVYICIYVWFLALISQFLIIANRKPGVGLFEKRVLYNPCFLQFGGRHTLSERGRLWRNVSWASVVIFVLRWLSGAMIVDLVSFF